MQGGFIFRLVNADHPLAGRKDGIDLTLFREEANAATGRAER